MRSGAAARTVHGALLDAALAWGARPFQRADAGTETVSYAQFRDAALAVARGLAGLGLRPGERVALLAENSPRWLAADVGTLAAGGVVVPRGAGAPVREVAAIVTHAGCRFAFVETREVLDRVRGALAGVEAVVLLRGACDGAMTWDELAARGGAAALPAVGPDDVATIVYTSGTTGDPRGVTLLHRNVTANVGALAEVLPVRAGDVFLCVLPTWHMYERTVEYYAASRGAVLAYTDLRRFRDDLAAERPHVVVGVPRLWEKVHDAVTLRIRERAWPARTLAAAALRGSLAFTRVRLRAQGLLADPADAASSSRRLRTAAGLAAWPLHVAAGALVHRRLRAATGGRLVAAVSGGATMPLHVDVFFAAAGVPLLVGYGLTETSPVVAVRRLDRNVIGTIGSALSGTELRSAAGDSADGAAATLRVRGPQVMRGYWRDEAATRRVLGADGWFDTGDVVDVTARGDLVFRGRAKDTIVLSGGENVEPEPIETAILASPRVAQVVVVGQDRKGLAALVWPDPEVPGAGDAAAVLRDVEARTGPCAGFRAWEAVTRVALLPAPLSVEDGTLTATLKTRRAEVARRYADVIRSLYEGEPREAEPSRGAASYLRKAPR